MQIKKERVAVKKRKEDFILLTAWTAGMDRRVLAAHNLHKSMILDEITAKNVVSVTSTPPPEVAAASTSASTTTSASTHASTSVNAPMMASISPNEHDEVAVLDEPATTQDAPRQTLPLVMFNLHTGL
jgi:hypothetical protein